MIAAPIPAEWGDFGILVTAIMFFFAWRSVRHPKKRRTWPPSPPDGERQTRPPEFPHG